MFTVQISGMTSGLLRVDDLLGQATVIFILSVGTVLFQQIRKAVIEPVEVFPIITLLLAQAAVCRVPYWRGQLTVLIYVGELVALISLFLWFWWIGMDTLPRSCDKDYAFFFAKVNIWGWYRKFNQATSVLIAITGFSSALFYMICESPLTPTLPSDVRTKSRSRLPHPWDSILMGINRRRSTTTKRQDR